MSASSDATPHPTSQLGGCFHVGLQFHFHTTHMNKHVLPIQPNWVSTFYKTLTSVLLSFLPRTPTFMLENIVVRLKNRVMLSSSDDSFKHLVVVVLLLLFSKSFHPLPGRVAAFIGSCHSPINTVLLCTALILWGSVSCPRTRNGDDWDRTAALLVIGPLYPISHSRPLIIFFQNKVHINSKLRKWK